VSGYLASGTVLCDRYEIGRELGRGGYSVVYLARDRRLNADVAVKLLVPPPAAAELARERMRREVQVVRSLSHANIVPVYEFMEDGPWSFIVMEYVAGPDLQVRVRERGRLAPDQAVRLGRDLAAALAAAHRRGILHRDVKPQNVLLDPDGRFRLTDFGSAKLDGQLGVTATGTVAGTPDYVAPEVAAGRRGDARADLYALGLTLYYALAGELPDRSRPAVGGSGCRPAAVVAGVPDWLDDVVARATAPAPEDRFPTVAALDEALAGQGTNAAEPAPRCALCGGPDPFAAGLCPGCGGGTDGRGQTLVVLQRPVGSAAVADARSRLTALLPGAGAEAASAALGERALFRTSPDAARRIVEQLATHQLPARSVPSSRVLELLPASFHLMLVAVIVAGAAAGLREAPTLRWVTPIFAGLLLLSAGRGAITPLVATAARADALPPDVERRLIDTLAGLAPGTARDLLADLTRLGHSVAAALRRAGGVEQESSALGELLVAGADAAADLALLDDSLGRFERQRERLALRPEGWADALARCERARDALVQRLLDAMAVLGRLQGQAAELGGKEIGLDEAVATLRGEAEAQQAAAREIAALLAPASS
jgi:predicted Ser/Thr protein kinase